MKNLLKWQIEKSQLLMVRLHRPKLKDLNFKELKEFLDIKSEKYDDQKFIENDPIQVPHLFTKKEDIEISGFLTASIAWGNRKSIIKSGKKIVELMDYSPFDFVMKYEKKDLAKLDGFVHRTFNSKDLIEFVKCLRYIYKKYGGIEDLISKNIQKNSLQFSIHKFKNHFFETSKIERSKKHIGDPLKNSAAKKINMFLRWMVRSNKSGVDFGIWKKITPSQLSCPLDVHSGNVARHLGLIKRKQNDAKAVMELDCILRKLDPIDPVKYDFALFGLGAFENFCAK